MRNVITCAHLTFLTCGGWLASRAAAAAAEEADVLDRLVKLVHSISNRPLAEAAPASRHALEAELKPLDDQVTTQPWVSYLLYLLYLLA
jgi:hypothetical protein